MFVVVCTDHSDKESQKQAGVESVIASGSLGSLMVSTLPEHGKICVFESSISKPMYDDIAQFITPDDIVQFITPDETVQFISPDDIVQFITPMILYSLSHLMKQYSL